MSHEFVHIDDLYNLTAEITEERDMWRRIAIGLYESESPELQEVLALYEKAMKDAA